MEPLNLYKSIAQILLGHVLGFTYILGQVELNPKHLMD